MTTVEVDPALAARAAARLEDAGSASGRSGATGRGGRGRRPVRPDRRDLLRTVRPPAWIEGTRPGGIVLVPWESPWLCYGLLRLTVDEYGGASGSFSPYSAFMLMRGQRTDLRIYRDVVRDHHVPQESATRLAPGAVAGGDWAAQFAIGLQLPGVWRTWHENPDVKGVASRLWLATTDAAPGRPWTWTGGPPTASPCGSTGRAGCGRRSRPPTAGGASPAAPGRNGSA